MYSTLKRCTSKKQVLTSNKEVLVLQAARCTHDHALVDLGSPIQQDSLKRGTQDGPQLDVSGG
jgi:hypothetical protein